MNLEKLESAKRLISQLVAAERRYQAKREKAATAHDQRKEGFDLASDRIGIDKLAHETHCAVVEAGLAPSYPDDYYGTEIVYDGWHEIKIERRRPNVV